MPSQSLICFLILPISSVVSAIRMRMPELARQSMGDHVSTSLNFTSLCDVGKDPFRTLQHQG